MLSIILIIKLLLLYILNQNTNITNSKHTHEAEDLSAMDDCLNHDLMIRSDVI